MHRIAHFIPYVGRDAGGHVISLASYVSELVALDWRVVIFTVTRQEDAEQILFDPLVDVVKCSNVRWGSFRSCRELWGRAEATSFDLIHSHSLWTDINRMAAVLAQRHGVPHLLCPGGTLARRAIRRHWWKKLPVGIWFQWRALKQATCLHAKSEREYEDIRHLGLRNPVAVIPNVVCIPDREKRMSVEQFRRVFRIAEGKNVLLYLGRLNPVKGLTRLIQAWAALRRHHTQWCLVLAGPDERSYQQELESHAMRSGCRDGIIFTGGLDDAQKWGALAAADLFVMPSDFENFGISIVEAMLSSVPVVTTTGTPWKELQTLGAGWWVPPTVEALAEALREGIEMSAEQRRVMGNAAANLASRFGPEKVMADLVAVYRWLLKEGPCPSCVRRD